jgi:hypothetical protein
MDRDLSRPQTLAVDWITNATGSEPARRLVWLPWHRGKPTLGLDARLQLACRLLSLQCGSSDAMLCSRRWADLGPDVYEARVNDEPADKAVTYRVYPDAVVVVEVLPDRPEYKEHTFPRLRRLRDYDARRPDLGGSEWLTGDAAGFLELTPQEFAIVRIRVRLAGQIVAVRRKRMWTREELAAALGTDRSRVAKMEQVDASVSIDLMVKALVALGLTPAQLGLVLAGHPGFPSWGRELMATGACQI